MPEHSKAPNVGAPDTELRNSPIFDDSRSDDLDLDLELEEGVCFFNNETFAIGSFVCSGDELLRCEERGIWIREGSCYEK